MHCTLLVMSRCYGVMAVKMSVLKVLPLEAQRGKRRARSMRQNACEEKEQQVEHLAEELQELHGDKLELNDAQYCLWARTIVTGNHGTTHLLDPPHYRSYS